MSIILLLQTLTSGRTRSVFIPDCGNGVGWFTRHEGAYNLCMSVLGNVTQRLVVYWRGVAQVVKVQFELSRSVSSINSNWTFRFTGR